jgi:hypothetical protein
MNLKQEEFMAVDIYFYSDQAAADLQSQLFKSHGKKVLLSVGVDSVGINCATKSHTISNDTDTISGTSFFSTPDDGSKTYVLMVF